MDGLNVRHLALVIAMSSCMGSALAATSNDFVDKAAAGGIAEVETSLRWSTNSVHLNR